MPDIQGLRVAMIIQSYLPRLGGAEKQLAAVCRKLRMKGIEPCVITRRYKNMQSFEIIDETPVYRVPAPKPKVLAAFSYLFFGLAKIHEIKPDLIHAHELLSPTDMTVLAKRIWRIPAAVKVLRGGNLGDIYKLKNRGLGQARIRRMAKHIDRFIAISDEIAEELAGVGIEPDRCSFIPNGVDIDVYKPVTRREKKRLREELDLPDGFLCVFSGRLAPEKGLKTLISVWQKIESSHKEAYLLILGNGPLEDELRSTAVKNVIFRGYLSEPKDYYQACDAFILPSETEGLSNALLEAMACGLTVMATKVGAAQEIIKDDVNGVLLEPGNVQDITKSVESILNEPQKMQHLGKSARRTVERDFSLENIVDRLVDLYAQMMEGERC